MTYATNTHLQPQITDAMYDAILAHDWFSHEEYNLFMSDGTHVGAMNDQATALAWSNKYVVITYNEDGLPIRLQHV